VLPQEPPKTSQRLDSHHGPQPLDVRNEVPGGIGLEARIGPRAPTSALVEQEHAVAFRVEELSLQRRTAATRAAVQKHGGLALGVSAHLPIHLMAVADIEPAAVERFDGRIQRTHGGFPGREPCLSTRPVRAERGSATLDRKMPGSMRGPTRARPYAARSVVSWKPIRGRPYRARCFESWKPIRGRLYAARSFVSWKVTPSQSAKSRVPCRVSVRPEPSARAVTSARSRSGSSR
jgi:hypothetical protein